VTVLQQGFVPQHEHSLVISQRPEHPMVPPALPPHVHLTPEHDAPYLAGGPATEQSPLQVIVPHVLHAVP
jgi:hypothetical protein